MPLEDDPNRLADGPPDGRWRRSAKALLVDDEGRLLLLHMRDPVDLVTWWELPGGGLEPGEDARSACAREIAEETGILVPLESVSAARWHRKATFRWLGRRRWQQETVHVVRMQPGAPVPPVAVDLTDEEQGSVLGTRWWTPAELSAHGGTFYPGRLAEFATRVLAGHEVDEGFERWS